MNKPVRTLFVMVRVQTRASKPSIESLGPNEFRIRVSAPPVKGAANREVIKDPNKIYPGQKIFIPKD